MCLDQDSKTITELCNTFAGSLHHREGDALLGFLEDLFFH